MRPLIGIPCAGNLRSKYRRYCAGKRYCHVVEMAGGAPVLLPLLKNETLLDLYQRLDGLLLVGGGDIAPRHFGEVRQVRLISVDPPRDRAELELIRRAVGDDLPLLAICRGVQVLNVALGGTLYQDIATQLPSALRHNFRFDQPAWRISSVCNAWASTVFTTRRRRTLPAICAWQPARRMA
jgi:putative glutamine amidotransferase